MSNFAGTICQDHLYEWWLTPCHLLAQLLSEAEAWAAALAECRPRQSPAAHSRGEEPCTAVGSWRRDGPRAAREEGLEDARVGRKTLLVP